MSDFTGGRGGSRPSQTMSDFWPDFFLETTPYNVAEPSYFNAEGWFECRPASLSSREPHSTRKLRSCMLLLASSWLLTSDKS